MKQEKIKQLPKEEVAVIKNILSLFSVHGFTYKQSLELLPEVDRVLRRASLNEKVRN